MKRIETEVLIIGAGLTGAGIARDLALRHVPCLVVEGRDVNAGASGRNHGLLHSGARYVSNDPATATECYQEGRLLKRLAAESIDDCGGLYVALPGDDESFIASFPDRCRRCSIPVEEVDPGTAREMEPELNPDIIAAYQVPDAAVDPFKLCFDNLADARRHGAGLLTYHRVVAMKRCGKRIESVLLEDLRGGRRVEVSANQVVNAAGAWVGEIAALAGSNIETVWSKGSVLITQQRISRRVVNWLRPPGDGDIVVPGGTVSLTGTTSVRIDRLDAIEPTFAEVDFLVKECAQMLPVLESTRYIRSFAGVRPLLRQSGAPGDRSISRGFMIIDHRHDKIGNLVSIAGGKLTTYRLMAEKTSDLVCARLGIDARCQTRRRALPSRRETDWILPGKGAELWRADGEAASPVLCECEMIPAQAVEEILDALHPTGSPPNLSEISLRSRLGKGSCQGAFCSLRTIAYLYDRGLLTGLQGLQQIRAFLEQRWHGVRPILWGSQLVQEHLQEALHRAFLNIGGNPP